jgi:membrane protease YdiL (CAAX protease family)
MKNGNFLQRYPVIPYTILAFILPAPIFLLGIIPLPFESVLIYASWTPNLAAFIVIGLILREKGGVRRLISGWKKWRVGFQWYLIALSPLFIAFLAVGIYRLLGGIPGKPLQPLGQTLLISLFLSTVTGAMGEELGWRGFLLPRIQAKYNALASSLIVGVIWALWHLPLWTIEGQIWEATPYWTFALGVISSSVLFTFVLNNTNGSLLLATLIHLAMNFGLNMVLILGWIPTPAETMKMISILLTLLAIVISVIAGPKKLSKSDL